MAGSPVVGASVFKAAVGVIVAVAVGVPVPVGVAVVLALRLGNGVKADPEELVAVGVEPPKGSTGTSPQAARACTRMMKTTSGPMCQVLLACTWCER